MNPAATPYAYEVDGRRVPRQAFYAVACDPRRSVAVQACAGAGKTWMLVSRILRALLDGVAPHEILAITFTKKAAGEMRARLQQWLQAYAHADDAVLRHELSIRGLPPEAVPALVQPLRDLYGRLLETGRPVQIRTFHSWFAALLRAAPLSTLERLGLPARHELLENDKDAIALVWRPFHEAVLRDPQARVDYEACIAEHGRTQTFKALGAALDKRVEFTLADHEGVVDVSVQSWDQAYPEFAGPASVVDVILQPGVVRTCLQEAARWLGRATQPSYAAFGSQLERALTEGHWEAAIRALLTDKNTPRKYSDNLAGLPEIRQAQALAQRLVAAREQETAWHYHQRIARLARILIAQFAQLKRDEGWVDMSDLEQAALMLLSDPVLSGWVQQRLDARVRHLLVDEFQDTNPLQWQALHAWLSAYAGAGAGDAPGVFIVGDPKQSIYRFRRAEPQVFRAAQRFVVEGLGGALLGCDHTHRNAGAVLASVNAVMRQAQDGGHYEDFRAHTTESKDTGHVRHLPQIGREARAAAETAAGDNWRDSLLEPRALPEEHLITLESRQAARWIARQLADGVAPEAIMVLARRRKRLAALEDELRFMGIPAQQPEKTNLGEAPEVQDLVALLDVLVSPTHDLSLARALRSPLFSVPDDALVALAQRARAVAGDDPPRHWFDGLQEAGADLPAALRGVGETLARWKRWVDRMPPHDALDAIFHEGDVLARFAQAVPTALRAPVLANLRALLGAALEVGGGRYATPYAFVRAMRAGGVRAPAVAQSSAVQLLTVHGAKGLEAPIVLILDADGAAAQAQNMGMLVDWPGEAPAPRRFAFVASETRPPVCCADALAVERQARQREELNGLYVAMTRARSVLVMSSVEPHAPAEGSWWRRLQPQCQPVPDADLAPAPAAAGDPTPTCRLDIVPWGEAAREGDAAGASAVPVDLEEGHSRFGQALHRLLECWPQGQAACPPALSQRVAREFRLAASALEDAAAVALRILRGEGAWAWDPQVVDWADNEVELHHQGQLLRLDRLVRRRDGAQWWVLDYKSAARPERDEALLAQMRRYRAAVAAIHPGAVVKAAFLTGQGRLVAVD
ncbi:MAG: putative ATP-dependent nuclease subunit [Pseudomonadota bacterium]|jgi:ATP-dependent helicase/nuclease subunit A